MADINLKTLTPDTSLPTDGFLFGADSQSAANPSVFTTQAVATTLLGSTSLTGNTVTTSQPVLNLSQTWNAGAVTFTGLKFNATDTASAAASLLADLQVGGATKLRVRKDGKLYPGGANYIGLTSDTSQVYFSDDATSRSIFSVRSYLELGISSATYLGWSSSVNATGTIDLFLYRAAAATLQLGAADAAAPVAQTLQVQSVVAGTTNTAGANWTLKGSAGTGTGAGGSIIFQVAPAGSSGTAQNALATALTIDSTQKATFGGNISGPTNANLSITTGSAGYALLLNSGVSIFSDRLRVNAGAFLSFFSSSVDDVILARDAANTLALRNGTTAQTYRIYNTYTDASNNEYLTLDWSSVANQVTIGTVANGTGLVRTINLKSNYQLNLYSANGAGLYFSTNGTFRWYFDGAAGHFLANADNTYDIGASGANRPRNIYAGTRVYSGSAAFENTAFYFSNGTSLLTSANGVLTLTNGAQNDFTRLNFGGTTSSFPALKRSSATLQVRLADDSAFADIGARGVIHNGVTFANLPGTPTTGTVAYVTDASNAGAAWGDSVTAGGSTNKYLVWYNGTNWTVIGK